MNGHDESRTQLPPNRHPDSAAIYQQLERVVSDPLFSSSKRFTSLLRFIVERTVDGQHDSLKERIIGIEIFGRTPDYDTSIDASVRVAVTELRKRLHAYYQNPEHQHEFRIELPTRSYIAEFTQPGQSPLILASKRRRSMRVLSIAISLATVIVLVLAWSLRREMEPVPATDRFWAPLMSTSSRVMVAVGTPPTERRQPISLPELPAGSSARLSLNEIVALQPAIPFNDVVATDSICSFLGTHGRECVTRVAQAIAPAELRTAPLVLIGGMRNDWSMRLGMDLRFRLAHDSTGDMHWIEDATNPAMRTWAVNMSSPIQIDQVTEDYALINRVLDPGTGQWWVGVAGLTGLGTLAAEQVLVDPKIMASLSQQFPKGWERRNLQIVLQVKILRGIPSGFQPVAIYSW